MYRAFKFESVNSDYREKTGKKIKNYQAQLFTFHLRTRRSVVGRE
jgi:hypothetical protein